MPLSATAPTAGGILSSDLRAGDVAGVVGGVVDVVEVERLLVNDGAGAARQIWELGSVASFRCPCRRRGSWGCGVCLIVIIFS
jgi:hypothetical protein